MQYWRMHVVASNVQLTPNTQLGTDRNRILPLLTTHGVHAKTTPNKPHSVLHNTNKVSAILITTLYRISY